MSRCVRRAFLCGEDHFTRACFDHRKRWLERRILSLSSIFSIDTYGYAIMSNHFHLVLYRDPERANNWTDQEVARRWLLIFPPKQEKYSETHDQLLNNQNRLNRCRVRLASISWLMRCMKEPLARSANREDQCTGRFWEGRFRSQALLDQASILSCMAYVDLNPIRTGQSGDIENAEHTSICERLRQSKTHPELLNSPMASIAPGNFAPEFELIRLADYLELVGWSARRMVSEQSKSETVDSPSALNLLPHSEKAWLRQMEKFEQDWQRAAGSIEKLKLLACRLGQRYMHGISTAYRIYQPLGEHPN